MQILNYTLFLVRLADKWQAILVIDIKHQKLIFINNEICNSGLAPYLIRNIATNKHQNYDAIIEILWR